MNTSQIHHPAKEPDLAKTIGLGVVIFAALAISYSALSRLVEDLRRPVNTGGRGEEMSPNQVIMDLSVPPLKPFTRTSPRFAREITFAGIRDCPTPGLIGQAEYFASEGFERRTDAFTRFCNWFRKHPLEYRHVQQPEQTIRFISSLPITEIYPALDSHFKKYNLPRNLRNSRPVTAAGTPADLDGNPVDPRGDVSWHAYHFAPWPRPPSQTNGYNPTAVHIYIKQHRRNEATNLPLPSPHTDVEIQSEESKYPIYEG
jgi:hypothetical protein